MFKKMLFSLLVPLALILVVGVNSAVASAEDQCVPCEQQGFKLNLSLYPENFQGLNIGFSRVDRGWASSTRLFNSMARTYTLDARNTRPVDQLQLTGGCYYQFMGPTKCVAHTWYGYFCLSGSWYCTVFGTCKWIPIGSCQ